MTFLLSVRVCVDSAIKTYMRRWREKYIRSVSSVLFRTYLMRDGMGCGNCNGHTLAPPNVTIEMCLSGEDKTTVGPHISQMSIVFDGFL